MSTGQLSAKATSDVLVAVAFRKTIVESRVSAEQRADGSGEPTSLT